MTTSGFNIFRNPGTGNMPGSTAAVRLAMEKLVIPEIAHLVREARR